MTAKKLLFGLTVTIGAISLLGGEAEGQNAAPAPSVIAKPSGPLVLALNNPIPIGCSAVPGTITLKNTTNQTIKQGKRLRWWKTSAETNTATEGYAYANKDTPPNGTVITYHTMAPHQCKAEIDKLKPDLMVPTMSIANPGVVTFKVQNGAEWAAAASKATVTITKCNTSNPAETMTVDVPQLAKNEQKQFSVNYNKAAYPKASFSVRSDSGNVMIEANEGNNGKGESSCVCGTGTQCGAGFPKCPSPKFCYGQCCTDPPA